MVTLYGIKSCDTMKKARTWLETHNIEFAFHDYKKDGLPEALLDQWLQQLPWQDLINRRGTTWRKLPEPLRDSMDESQARAVMLENPSIIKRPLLDTGDGKHLGFKAEHYQQIFNL